MTTIIINDGQRGILSRNGQIVEYLRPGRHSRSSLFSHLEVKRFDVYEYIVSPRPETERLLPGDEATILQVPTDHVALVTAHEQPQWAIAPGRYVLWQVGPRLEVTLVPLTGTLTAIPVSFWELAAKKGMVQDVVVHPYERVIVHIDGEMAAVLEAGRHGINAWNRQVELVRVDLREQMIQVVGQELMTRDKVSLRLSVLLKYKIVDPELMVRSIDDVYGALYAEAQLAAREQLGAVTVDELLEGRGDVAKRMVATVVERLAGWGIAVVRLELKDIVLPGDMKTLLNRVIEAEKQAAAQNILRREEVAATRSLANTARLLENNPSLRRLKELEAFKDIATRIDKLTVVVSPKDLQGHLKLEES